MLRKRWRETLKNWRKYKHLQSKSSSFFYFVHLLFYSQRAMTRSVRLPKYPDHALHAPVLLQSCQFKLTKHLLVQQINHSHDSFSLSILSCNHFCSCSSQAQEFVDRHFKVLSFHSSSQVKYQRRTNLWVAITGLRDQSLFILCVSFFSFYFRSLLYLVI